MDDDQQKDLQHLEQVAEELKERYGAVFHVEVADMHFFFRIINRAEYRMIFLADLDVLSFQEAVCQTAVLYPETYDFATGPAGVAEVVSDAVMTASCLVPGQAKEVLNAFREEMKIFDHQAECLIHEAFPEFRLEEIEEFTVEQTLYYLSRAEYILNNFRNIQIVQIGQDGTEEEISYEKNEPRQEAAPRRQTAPPAQAQPPQRNDMTFEQFENMPELKWFKGENELSGDF